MATRTAHPTGRDSVSNRFDAARTFQETTMGLFDRLFGSDPKKDLAKAEEWLERGRPDRALELARKAAADESLSNPVRAQEVMVRAREMLLQNALEMSATAEDSEFWEDAIDWIDRALEQVEEPQKRAELAARRRDLEAKSEAAEQAVPEVDADQVDEEVGADGLHPDDHFGALVDMLDEDVANAYRSQGEIFRDAYLNLHGGQPEKALESLDALIEAAPADPCRRFERARARLLLGDAAGAQADLEVAMDEWGDIYLDRAATLSVVGLWSEALLDQKKPEPVIDRLAELAEPSNGQPDLSLPYALALVMAKRNREASEFLDQAVVRFKEPDFPLLRCQLLLEEQRQQEAMDLLETTIAPSCATGNCAKPPLHLPTARLLVSLYLDRAEPSDADLARCESLLTHIAQRQSGRLAWQDHQLVARLHRHEGDDEAAAEAEAEADRLRQLAAGRLEKADVEMQPQGQQQRAPI